ncbi:TPA: hypothetical protein DEG21_04390 [Patescibacteria group bacterium]|nr:hypothetical protein [Candidatus Gracilibacteria bacterium]HBY75075.1 hypothetical protein [Candidatus Gracilibacteria bacterium]
MNRKSTSKLQSSFILFIKIIILSQFSVHKTILFQILSLPTEISHFIETLLLICTNFILFNEELIFLNFFLLFCISFLAISSGTERLLSFPTAGSSGFFGSSTLFSGVVCCIFLLAFNTST